MRIRDEASRRAALGLAVAALGAGLIGGPWATPLRSETQALLTAPTTMPAPPSPVPARSGGNGADRHVVTGSPTERAQAAVDAAVTGLAAGRSQNSISVAGLDTATGVRVGWGPGSGMTVASVFKLLLLEGSLLQDQDSGRTPGAGRSDALTAMIENSDNDSADETYLSLGGHSGVTSMLRRLGLTATVLAPADQWGLSTTSAADQLTLLDHLVSPQSPLSSSSRAYALGLMTGVESDQRWGVGAAADSGTDFANKDGWLDVDDDGGRWAVNSVGVIEVGGHRVLLAVLTQHDADLAGGTALVESLSRTVAAALRGASTAGNPGTVAGSPPHG